MDVIPLLKLNEVYTFIGQLQEAKKYIDQAIVIAPEDCRTLYQVILKEMANGKIEAAQEVNSFWYFIMNL